MEKTGKLKMISLKEEMKLERFRKMKTREERGFKMRLAELPPMGNKDHGCPFRGKDRFSGQFKKFADRIYEAPSQHRKTPKDASGDVQHVLVYQNSKY